MKANELMLGDLVYNHRNWICPIVEIHKDSAVVVAGHYGEEEFKLNDLRPIPLTAEILEKNEFKSYILENHLETLYSCQDVSKAVVADELYVLWPNQDGSFYLLLRVGGKDMVRMNVHYIHQFQHALRLCGIEKEIIL